MNTMRWPRTVRRKKEVSVEELEARLGEVNSGNLRNLTTALQEGLLKEGISSGFIVVGGFTYPKHSLTIEHSDVDVIIATNDEELLVPFDRYPADAVVKCSIGSKYDCRFSDRVAAVLSQLEIEGMDKYDLGWYYGEQMGDAHLRNPRWRGDIATIDPGRPNTFLGFNEGTELHLSVLYYSPNVLYYKPACFNFKKDGSDQYTFGQVISMERLEKNPFCLLLKPKSGE